MIHRLSKLWLANAAGCVLLLGLSAIVPSISSSYAAGSVAPVEADADGDSPAGACELFCDDYARNDCILGAYRDGGEWVCDPVSSLSAWHVASAEPPDAGSLCVMLDRTILSNDLVCAVYYRSRDNATLFLDLLDANGAVVVGDLYGNIIEADNQHAVTRMVLPLAACAQASLIRLRRGVGAITIYDMQLYADEDGIAADREALLGTSGHCADTDGNNVNNYDESLAKKDADDSIHPDADSYAAPESCSAKATGAANRPLVRGAVRTSPLSHEPRPGQRKQLRELVRPALACTRCSCKISREML